MSAGRSLWSSGVGRPLGGVGAVQAGSSGSGGGGGSGEAGAGSKAGTDGERTSVGAAVASGSGSGLRPPKRPVRRRRSDGRSASGPPVPEAAAASSAATAERGVGTGAGRSRVEPFAESGRDVTGPVAEAGLEEPSAGPGPVGATERRGTVPPTGGRVGRVTRRVDAEPASGRDGLVPGSASARREGPGVPAGSDGWARPVPVAAAPRSGARTGGGDSAALEAPVAGRRGRVGSWDDRGVGWRSAERRGSAPQRRLSAWRRSSPSGAGWAPGAAAAWSGGPEPGPPWAEGSYVGPDAPDGSGAMVVAGS